MSERARGPRGRRSTGPCPSTPWHLSPAWPGSWLLVCTWAPGSWRKSVLGTFLGTVTLWGSHVSPGQRMDKPPLFTVVRTSFYSCSVLSCVPGRHHRNVHSRYVHVCAVWQLAGWRFRTWGRVHRCPEAGRLLCHPRQRPSGRDAEAPRGMQHTVLGTRHASHTSQRIASANVIGTKQFLKEYLRSLGPVLPSEPRTPASSARAPAGWAPRPPPPH